MLCLRMFKENTKIKTPSQYTKIKHLLWSVCSLFTMKSIFFKCICFPQRWGSMHIFEGNKTDDIQQITPNCTTRFRGLGSSPVSQRVLCHCTICPIHSRLPSPALRLLLGSWDLWPWTTMCKMLLLQPAFTTLVMLRCQSTQFGNYSLRQFFHRHKVLFNFLFFFPPLNWTLLRQKKKKLQIFKVCLIS